MKPTYKLAAIAIIVFWVFSIAVFAFFYFKYGSSPEWYNWVIQFGITAALLGIARYFDRWPGPRQNPIGLLSQILYLIGMLTCTAAWVFWGSPWFAPLFAIAWAMHVRSWFRLRTARKVAQTYFEDHAKDADAAEPPVNVKVTLVNGREMAVDCVYMYTDQSGMRRWRIITPLPMPAVSVSAEVRPPRTTIHFE